MSDKQIIKDLEIDKRYLQQIIQKLILLFQVKEISNQSKEKSFGEYETRILAMELILGVKTNEKNKNNKGK